MVKNKEIEKFYYDIKVECLLPATLNYRILAETPEQAVELIRNKNPDSIKHRLIGKKNIKLTVYDAGCSLIKLVLNVWH